MSLQASMFTLRVLMLLHCICYTITTAITTMCLQRCMLVDDAISILMLEPVHNCALTLHHGKPARTPANALLRLIFGYCLLAELRNAMHQQCCHFLGSRKF